MGALNLAQFWSDKPTKNIYCHSTSTYFGQKNKYRHFKVYNTIIFNYCTNLYNRFLNMQAGTTLTPKDQPPTAGKVVLLTTNGQIQIELWSKEMPLACRNFIQHSLNGYYNQTIFHRMIPGFMIQGGDPTGTGTGGQSIWGEPFKNEYHQRIKFSRRGMVAMANSGKDLNRSQFFLTFGQCPHLNKDHTIFGKIVGDSIYTLLSFQSLDTDSTDKPLDPPYIRKVKVMVNPFDDIIPQIIKKEKKVTENSKNKEQKVTKINKAQIKKLKNKKKLTFDDEDYQPTDEPASKIKSSHDVLNDEKLSKQLAITAEELDHKRKQKEQQQRKKQQIINNMNEAMNNPEKQSTKSLNDILEDEIQKKRKNANQAENTMQDEILNYHKTINPQTGKLQIRWGNEMPIPEEQNESDAEQKMQRLRELQERQYEGLRADQLNFKKMKQGTMKQRRKQLVAEEKQLLSNVEKRKYQFLRKEKLEKREGQVFDKIAEFQKRLAANQPNDWMCHKLKFHIDSENAYNLDKKNQERKLRDDDDGGLKVEYD